MWRVVGVVVGAGVVRAGAPAYLGPRPFIRRAWSPSSRRTWKLRLSCLRTSARHPRLPPSRSAALVVVGAVGAVGPARGLRGFIERPAQCGRSLAGEMSGRAALVGLMDGDVQAGVADGLSA